ncbi:MAG: Druantia anti-phage system protein DruA [Bacillota bacterium]
MVPSERTDAPGQISGRLAELEPVAVEPVRDKEELRLWNEYVERYHPLGYKVPFGAHQRYFIWGQAERLGRLLFRASAWELKARDAFIGGTAADRQRRLELVVNNGRFLIFPWVRVKNLASRALALAARRISGDWLSRYGYARAIVTSPGIGNNSLIPKYAQLGASTKPIRLTTTCGLGKHSCRASETR